MCYHSQDAAACAACYLPSAQKRTMTKQKTFDSHVCVCV